MLPKRLARGIWMLGFVSLFMDVSSEMIHAILPLFVAGTLGASAALVGHLEGIAAAAAQVSKLFSGVLSDRWGSRKGLALLGYGLAAVSPRASSTGWARASAAPRAMRWWPTSRRRGCAVRPSGFASRSTRWAPSPGRIADLVLAGLLWDGYGPAATFLAGGGFAVVTLLRLVWMKPGQPQHEQG